MSVYQRSDVVIIGAGPAGLSAAIYTGRARLSTVVLEKGLPGGQILITDWIENYPGFPDGVAPFALMEGFQKQAVHFGAEIVTDEAVEIVPDSAPGEPKGWIVRGRTADYPARAVIVAVGAQYRRLGLPEEGRLTGRGVSYCATCDGAFFRDREIAVVGGGDTALMEAAYLTKFARRVRLVHRRDKLRGTKILQERIFANPKITVEWNSIIERILGDDQVEGVILKDTRDGTLREVRLEGVFISIGMDPQSEFVKRLLSVNDWSEILVDGRMAASKPGIFAAGDVVVAAPHQVAAATGTGVTAALSVVDYLSKFE
jgi:thioredoxin reductase (NADPH)